MREAVIVSTARTPITKAQRGEFNLIAGPTLAAHAVSAAVERSGIDHAPVSYTHLDVYKRQSWARPPSMPAPARSCGAG